MFWSVGAIFGTSDTMEDRLGASGSLVLLVWLAATLGARVGENAHALAVVGGPLLALFGWMRGHEIDAERKRRGDHGRLAAAVERSLREEIATLRARIPRQPAGSRAETSMRARLADAEASLAALRATLPPEDPG